MARMEITGKGSKFIVLTSACIIISGIYFGREVLIPLALAMLISFLLTPAVSSLERLHFRRSLAVVVVVGAGLALVLSFGYVVGRQFVSVVGQLPSYQGELRSKIEDIRKHGKFFQNLESEAKSFSAGTGTTQVTQPATAPAETVNGSASGAAALEQHSGTAPQTQPGNEHAVPVRVVEELSPVQLFEQYAGTVLDPLATAGLVLILVIFMLLQREDLRDRIIRLMGRGKLNLTTQALDDTGTRISRYLGALAIVNAIYGLLVAVGLLAISHFFGHGRTFPNVLVWGLLVGLFRFVPYIGIWLGAAVPLLLSFALFPGSGVFLGTVLMFVVLEVVVSQFVEPYWYGASTGMSALAVLVSAVFWTWLWGPIGLLLSTPLTVCLVVLGKYVPQLQFLEIMLGDEPVLPAHERVYQRLIASDEEEATELVQGLRKEMPLEEIYDQVLIPALAMAELDHHKATLDEHTLDFAHQTIRDIVEEMGDQEADNAAEESADQKDKQKEKEKEGNKDKRDNGEEEEKTKHMRVPKDCVLNVLLLPARGESDQIVALMLHQLLEMRGYCPETAAVDSLASEMVNMVAAKKSDIVAVSAMPPAAIAHARYLCKRVHLKFPEMVMAVGLWGARGDLRKARRRIACAEKVPVVSTLSQMQRDIDQLAQPIIVRATAGT
jgi:predicted PurR-regulated permease PerM